MATALSPIAIGKHQLGPGHPCYIIAEAGSNHNGNLQQALALIDVAADARCDAVKFQVFKASRLYPPGAGASDYLGDPRSIDEIIAAMELPESWIPTLHAHCQKRGLDFLSSAFDEGAVDLIAPWVDAFKCASYEMTHTPLLQYMVRKGKPVLLSTGAATLDEVGQAVAAVRAVQTDRQKVPLILLQCTAAYPAPLHSANVRALAHMRETFGVLTGLSDHTRAATAAIAAVALGAVVVEKHFTLSNRLPGPDHSFALEPRELHELVAAIRDTEAALGDGLKIGTAVEAELRHFARRSVFTSQIVNEGDVLTEENTQVLRRGKLAAGLDPHLHPAVLGHRAARTLGAFVPLQAADVADAPELHEHSVQLRRAGPDDAKAVWQYNDAPATRAVSLSTAAIPWTTHQQWFAERLADPHCRLWIIEQDGASCGVVRVDKQGDYGVISIALDQGAQGHGVGRTALIAASQRYFGETGDREVQALILPTNLPSLRAFAAAGFEPQGQRQVGTTTVYVYVRRA